MKNVVSCIMFFVMLCAVYGIQFLNIVILNKHQNPNVLELESLVDRLADRLADVLADRLVDILIG